MNIYEPDKFEEVKWKFLSEHKCEFYYYKYSVLQPRWSTGNGFYGASPDYMNYNEIAFNEVLKDKAYQAVIKKADKIRITAPINVII